MASFELPHGRGPPRTHRQARHDHVRENSHHTGYDDRRPSRRSLEDPRYGSQQTKAGRDHRGANRHHHRGAKVAFEPAMEDLCVGLETAVAFFRNFEHQFAMETHGIRLYARRETLEKLWIAKVKASDRDSQRDRHHANSARVDPLASYETYDNGQQMPSAGFQAMGHRLRQLFVNALNASPHSTHQRSDRGSGIETESTQRLLKKIADAYKELGALAGKSTKHQVFLAELVKEAELVHGYIDKSRAIWQANFDEVRSSRVAAGASGYVHNGKGEFDDEAPSGSEGEDAMEPQQGRDEQW